MACLRRSRTGPRTDTFGEFNFSLYTHTLGPNRRSCTNGSAYQSGAWTATSSHPGGVNAAFGDGHVRFISDEIQRDLWRGIGSRNGSEAIDPFDRP